MTSKKKTPLLDEYACKMRFVAVNSEFQVRKVEYFFLRSNNKIIICLHPQLQLIQTVAYNINQLTKQEALLMHSKFLIHKLKRTDHLYI